MVGALFHHTIKTKLFHIGPVVAALALGGLVMICSDRLAAGRSSTRTLASLTRVEALVIGCAQCLALWPGMSRSMVTMVAAIWLGLPAVAAAEYSFLLALPTLGAATIFDVLHGGHDVVRQIGGVSRALGFATAVIVAAAAIQGLIRYLGRSGLAVFGWYRIGLAACVWMRVR